MSSPRPQKVLRNWNNKNLMNIKHLKLLTISAFGTIIWLFDYLIIWLSTNYNCLPFLISKFFCYYLIMKHLRLIAISKLWKSDYLTTTNSKCLPFLLSEWWSNYQLIPTVYHFCFLNEIHFWQETMTNDVVERRRVVTVTLLKWKFFWIKIGTM